MVAVEIAHDPQVRQATREAYYSKAKITVRPTKKGRKEIEDLSVLSGLSYVTNKPVVTLKADQYLHLQKVGFSNRAANLCLLVHVLCVGSDTG